jgi:hypothetical protein
MKRVMTRTWTITVATLTALALVGSGAHAEEPVRKPRRPAPKVIELEAMVIEGKVAKPQVFYVLGRSRVLYENLKLQRVFVDRIIEGAKKNPF